MQFENLIRWAAEQPEILALYLHGSVAEGRANRLSDTDIGILVTLACSRAEVWDLELQWSMHWPQSVDLRILNYAPPAFQYEVMAHGERLWRSDANAVAEIESLVWRRYWDERPRLERDWQVYVQHLEERRNEVERQQYQAALAKVRSVHQRVRKAAADRVRDVQE